VPTLAGSGGLLVAPPFARPDEATNVVSMWTMTQRAGSATYHLFTAGTSAAVLALCVAASELGFAAPWRPGGAAAQAASAVLGLHTSADGIARFRSHLFEVLGENALAVYIMGDQVGDAVQAMVPPDAPTWCVFSLRASRAVPPGPHTGPRAYSSFPSPLLLSGTFCSSARRAT
jgi:hypothetical protein